VKAHQDSTRSPLTTEDQKLGKTIAERGGIAVIPPKKNRVSKIDYDKEIGKLRRKVENFFGRIKRFRRVATRYDQKPENYFGFVALASIKDWIV
jgi:putative transposase